MNSVSLPCHYVGWTMSDGQFAPILGRLSPAKTELMNMSSQPICTIISHLKFRFKCKMPAIHGFKYLSVRHNNYEILMIFKEFC